MRFKLQINELQKMKLNCDIKLRIDELSIHIVTR